MCGLTCIGSKIFHFTWAIQRCHFHPVRIWRKVITLRLHISSLFRSFMVKSWFIDFIYIYIYIVNEQMIPVMFLLSCHMCIAFHTCSGSLWNDGPVCVTWFLFYLLTAWGVTWRRGNPQPLWLTGSSWWEGWGSAWSHRIEANPFWFAEDSIYRWHQCLWSFCLEAWQHLPSWLLVKTFASALELVKGIFYQWSDSHW